MHVPPEQISDPLMQTGWWGRQSEGGLNRIAKRDRDLVAVAAAKSYPLYGYNPTAQVHADFHQQIY